MGVVNIHLPSWIIQDGNYADFGAGDKASFALEFYCEKGPTSSPRRDRCLLSVGELYDAVGRIVYLAEDWWVVDFGVLAFREDQPPEGLGVGAWVQGTISLGVDPYFYSEYLCDRPSAPALIYSWGIVDILIETAPLLETKARHFVRDPTRLQRRSTARTDAWNDDGGFADYILLCQPEIEPLRKSMLRGQPPPH